MNIEIIAFYIAASFLVISSVGVVVSGNPIRSALFLILAFFSSSSLWILLQAEFLAILLILVYVGAVMVLFIYVIMIINLELSPLYKKFKAQTGLIWLIGVVIFTQLVLILTNRYLDPAQIPQSIRYGADYSNTEELGKLLFTQYLYPFEVAGMLLLLAIVSAIVLIAKEKREGKFQEPSEQNQVKKSDRLKIIKINSDEYKTDDLGETK